MKTVKLPEGFLTPIEASEILGKSLNTLANWRCQGEGPRFSKIGNNPIYHKDWILEYLNRPLPIKEPKPEGEITYAEAKKRIAPARSETRQIKPPKKRMTMAQKREQRANA